MRYRAIPVGDEFRVWDAVVKRWADDGYYQSLRDAQHACSALADLHSAPQLNQQPGERHG